MPGYEGRLTGVAAGTPGSTVVRTPAPPRPPKPTYSATTITNPPVTTPPPSPLDSVYFQNVAAYGRQAADRIAGYQQQQQTAANALPTFDYTSAPENLATGAFAGPGQALAQQHAAQVLAAQIAANRRGALSSTSLAQQLGGIDQSYQGRYATAQSNYQNLANRIATQIAAANDAQQVYNADQYRLAVERASALAQKSPALGQPTAPLTAPARVPPKGAPAGSRFSGTRPPGNWRGIGGGWWAPVKVGR
jgi:hypothetical protein